MQGSKNGAFDGDNSVGDILSCGLFEKIVVLPEQGGHTENGFLRIFRDFLHLRDNVVPDKIAGIGGVGVGRIGHVRNAVVRTPLTDFRTGVAEQGTNKTSAAQRVDAGESAGTAAAQKMKENGFEIVVGVVRRGDDRAPENCPDSSSKKA